LLWPHVAERPHAVGVGGGEPSGAGEKGRARDGVRRFNMTAVHGDFWRCQSGALPEVAECGDEPLCEPPNPLPGGGAGQRVGCTGAAVCPMPCGAQRVRHWRSAMRRN
jgi:hypothetical protein